ncbi:hypothetical protein OOJ09_14180 [Mesorhizobium qingshengii]|uniref:Uncharacterized protein n=1 Tax=Mesorhizobium qingshengii TaxID=1165689 RepID=A0ABT4QUS3_9HYPH|nr:hypothetical protein [Mesorhizobium qingshengii]MCZ8545336.1 hypothetical protein [Mesorhizobium qingshengii]
MFGVIGYSQKVEQHFDPVVDIGNVACHRQHAGGFIKMDVHPDEQRRALTCHYHEVQPVSLEGRDAVPRAFVVRLRHPMLVIKEGVSLPEANKLVVHLGSEVDGKVQVRATFVA